MDFSIPSHLSSEMELFDRFFNEQVVPHISVWSDEGTVPQSFFQTLGKEDWFPYNIKADELIKRSALRDALIMERIAIHSPGVAVSSLAHTDLGIAGLWLYGSEKMKDLYMKKAVKGEIIMGIGSTESAAGSDVAEIDMRAEKESGGWLLNGSKSYVTNGSIGHMAVIVALTNPDAERNRRHSMFLVDLNQEGVVSKKLNKKVWIPSDLSRVRFDNVFVSEDHLLGEEGYGIKQLLTIFTHSRVSISALALGTAVGAFELALAHSKKRTIFNRPLSSHQAKSFEMADMFVKIETARLMIWKACWAKDNQEDFRLESSLAKYTVVNTARDVTAWAADLFGAASVIYEHPIHKYPLDAWAVSLGEGTQDVQKLIIFREIMKDYKN